MRPKQLELFSPQPKTTSHSGKRRTEQVAERTVEAEEEHAAQDLAVRELAEQDLAAQDLAAQDHATRDLAEPARAVLVHEGQELAEPADEARPLSNAMFNLNNPSRTSVLASSVARWGICATTVQL